MTSKIALTTASLALAALAGCGTATTVTHTSAAPSSAVASTPTAPAAVDAGPMGTTYTSTYYGAPGYGNDTYRITLVKVVDPAKLETDVPTQLNPGTTHAAALEFRIVGVTGYSSDPTDGVTVDGTDGEAFQQGVFSSIDTDVYPSGTASLAPGEHGTFWVEEDLPAGVHVKSVRYEDVDGYTPPSTRPVTWAMQP